MINFRSHLQDKIQTILQESVGKNSDPTNFVVSFDNFLHDVQLDDTPFVVVNVRTAEKHLDGEIGFPHDLTAWTVHIYYIDLHETYHDGDDKRDNILSRVEKRLEEDRRLGNLVVGEGPGQEYVYDSEITAVLFDSAGQDGYYSFVSELYLNVYTAKT